MEDKKLIEKDFEKAADILNCEVAVVKAVTEVESRGDGFLEDGRPKILFEGHVFWRELKKNQFNPEKFVSVTTADILYSTWTREHYKGGSDEYKRLDKAMNIDSECALKSASWGMFQIMGFNHRLCNFDTVFSFVNAMKFSEFEHLKAFINFVISSRLDDELRQKQWAKFAKGYNGKGYKLNRYDEKLERAYKKYAK